MVAFSSNIHGEMKFLLVIQTKPASASREVCFGNPKMGLRSITSGQPTGITRPIPCPLRQTVDIAWTNGSCLQYSLTMVVLKFHAMSIVCIHGLGMDRRCAMGGLRMGRRQWAHFWGCQKRDVSWTCVKYLSKICPSKE